MNTLTTEAVAACLAPHTPLYRRRPPVYQTVMLNALARLWQGPHTRLLDVGGGTGVIAQAMQELLPVDTVTSVDVVDRFFGTLTVKTMVYDGTRLPFEDGHFDSATINNVLHHVPRDQRGAILAEIRRVVNGPLYIKDHVAGRWLDHQRLKVLDAIGNLPFKGQIEAWYLTEQEWEQLAQQGGYTIAARETGPYRTGLMERMFPNHLETTMRFDPV